MFNGIYTPIITPVSYTHLDVYKRQIEEKDKKVTLTDEGVAKCEKYFGIENLGDPANMEINHHVIEALKARNIMTVSYTHLLLYCADCGAKLYFCTCKIHYIREQVLYRIVLETIRQTLSYVRRFRKDFKLEMLAQDEESRKAELAEKQKVLSGAKKRMEDLDRIIQHIYEDNVLGKLSDSRYLKLSRQYEKEQAEIEQLAAVLEREIETQAGQVSDVNGFLKLVDKYLDIPELDAAILNELVSKIVVHSPVRENGRKQVRIDLYFTYVGQIRIPLKIGRESLNESEPA